jgi:hypothetical protein
MESTIQKDRKIIDIITGKEYDFTNNIKIQASQLGFCYTNISKLFKGKQIHINSRFIHNLNFDKCFILIDVDTNNEYLCINNKTIFIHLGLDYNDNEAKYVYELRKKRQALASICGKVFRLKNGKVGKYRSLKNQSNFVDEKRKIAKKRITIKYRISKRIWQAIKDNGYKKDIKSEKLLGCTIDFFLKYIENRFIKGMSFNNYGDWHFDHIKPCSHFDLSIESEKYKAFHYTNLQPIWATTKIAKKYGYDNYVGNLNKNNSYLYEDYKLTEIINSVINNKNIAKKMSDILVKNGVKKLG